jgi:hypothetical protein
VRGGYQRLTAVWALPFWMTVACQRRHSAVRAYLSNQTEVQYSPAAKMPIGG